LKAYRPERVSKEIMRVLSEVLREDISDPRLQGIIVLDVEITKDLKKAEIFYTLIKEEEKIEEILEKAKGFIRKKIAERMELKYMPEISFTRR
jgi:ribosome-binding factor A